MTYHAGLANTAKTTRYIARNTIPVSLNIMHTVIYNVDDPARDDVLFKQSVARRVSRLWCVMYNSLWCWWRADLWQCNSHIPPPSSAQWTYHRTPSLHQWASTEHTSPTEGDRDRDVTSEHHSRAQQLFGIESNFENKLAISDNRYYWPIPTLQ